MEKTCNFDSDISDFNSVDLKKAKKIIKGQIFFQRPNLKAKGQKMVKGQIFFQRPNLKAKGQKFQIL